MGRKQGGRRKYLEGLFGLGISPDAVRVNFTVGVRRLVGAKLILPVKHDLGAVNEDVWTTS